MGPMPSHEWKGSKLRFEKPDREGDPIWGEWTELRGPRGFDGAGGGGGGGRGPKGDKGDQGIPGVGLQEIFILADPGDPTPSPGYAALVFRPTLVPGQYEMELVQ